MDKNELIHLKIEPEDEGDSIYLDDKKIHHVEDYRIEKSKSSGTATLTIKVLVKYP